MLKQNVLLLPYTKFILYVRFVCTFLMYIIVYIFHVDFNVTVLCIELSIITLLNNNVIGNMTLIMYILNVHTHVTIKCVVYMSITV